MTSESLTMRERELMMHAVGALWHPAEKWGFRNWFVVNRDDPAYQTLVDLEQRGLVNGRDTEGDPAPLVLFNVTEAGCRAAGLDDEQTRRALES